MGCDFVCVGFTPDSTDVGPLRRAAKIDSVIDVSMKTIADQVVARERTEAAPRGQTLSGCPDRRKRLPGRRSSRSAATRPQSGKSKQIHERW